MKNLLLFQLILLISLGFSLSSCTKNLCKDVSCLNGGIERTADNMCKCACPDGYFGERCEILDPCLVKTCINGEKSLSGETCDCICDEGYDGEACDNQINAHYYGTYNGSEICAGGNNSYPLQINPGDEPNKLLIYNLAGKGESTFATVEDNITITILSQPFTPGYTISGSGEKTGPTSVRFSFTYTTGFQAESCVFTGTK